MPISPPASLPPAQYYTDDGDMRTIRITGCQQTPGKFRVTQFLAMSQWDGGEQGAVLPGGVDSYFYMGGCSLLPGWMVGWSIVVGMMFWLAPLPERRWGYMWSACLGAAVQTWPSALSASGLTACLGPNT